MAKLNGVTQRKGVEYYVSTLTVPEREKQTMNMQSRKPYIRTAEIPRISVIRMISGSGFRFRGCHHL